MVGTSNLGSHLAVGSSPRSLRWNYLEQVFVPFFLRDVDVYGRPLPEDPEKNEVSLEICYTQQKCVCHRENEVLNHVPLNVQTIGPSPLFVQMLGRSISKY